MSRNLCVDVFDRDYAPVHEISAMADIPKLIDRMLEIVPGGQAGLAKRLGKGVNQPDVSRWRAGSEPKGRNYERIISLANDLGIIDRDVGSEDVADGLATGSGPPRKLRIKGSVGAGGQALLYSEGQGDHGSIPATDSDPPGAVAALIVGTSLGRFFDGWYAIYDNVRDPLTDDLIGKLCIVGLEDGRVLIKKVVRNGRRLDLLSNKEDEPAIEDARIVWAAKVIDVRQK